METIVLKAMMNEQKETQAIKKMVKKIDGIKIESPGIAKEVNNVALMSMKELC